MLTLYLSELLIHTAKVEKDVDIIRQLLCEDQLFHPYSVYKYLDCINQNSKGKVDHFDICTFLEKNGFIRSVQEAKTFIHNYDQDNDGTLQYGE